MFAEARSALRSKLAASHFGSRTNLVANQFESGVPFAQREDGRTCSCTEHSVLLIP
jgi:hypothetical protein